MDKRRLIAIGMGLGALWAVAAVALGRMLSIPIALIQPALLGAAFAPGLVLIAMIGRLAQRRFFDDATIDGERFAPGSPGEIDQRVLTNTVEQIVLALAIWPFAGLTAGAGVPLVLGFGFAVARVLFWVGYHLSPPLRAFGFAASFYPTVVAALVTLWLYLT